MPEPTLHILVVDDEPHISHMLRFLFERRGHQVTVASNGNEALDLIFSEKPDAVFLDLNLPGKDGFQICEEVRADDRFTTLPIFVLTAQGQDADLERGLEVGATEYITKPFSPSSLITILDRLAANPSSAE